MPIPEEKFTLRQLKEIEPALTKLLEARLDVKVSYRILKFTKKVLKELRDLESARINHVRTHGTLAVNGRREIPPAMMEDFQDAMDKLLDEEVTLQVMKVRISELATAGLSVGEVADLDFIIEDAEEVKPQPAP